VVVELVFVVGGNRMLEVCSVQHCVLSWVGSSLGFVWLSSPCHILACFQVRSNLSLEESDPKLLPFGQSHKRGTPQFGSASEGMWSL
jgi:hypothetical protein